VIIFPFADGMMEGYPNHEFINILSVPAKYEFRDELQGDYCCIWHVPWSNVQTQRSWMFKSRDPETWQSLPKEDFKQN